MRHAARVRAGSGIYVHDVRGFLWAVFLAIGVVDVPIAFNLSRPISALIAGLLQLAVIPLFFYLRTRFGRACKSQAVTVPLSHMEALELCLASLGELKDCKVTSLDEDEGEIHASTMIDGMRRCIAFSVNEWSQELSEIRVKCRPSESGVLMDLHGTNDLIVQRLTTFLTSFPEWEYEYDCNVRHFNQCAASQGRPGLAWGFAFALLLVLLTVAQNGKAAPATHATAVTYHYYPRPMRRVRDIDIQLARANVALADKFLLDGNVDQSEARLNVAMDFEKQALRDIHRVKSRNQGKDYRLRFPFHYANESTRNMAYQRFR